MEYKKLLDLHTHTDNSPDGHHSTMYMCECAERAGLRALAFTDHCEVDLYKQGRYDRTAVQSYFEVAKARSVFRGRLIVLEGIELGQPVYDVDRAEQIIGALDYDIILGSVHNLRGRRDFFELDYTQEDVPALLEEYFAELYQLAQWGGFDVLAHLTYPLRYMVGEHGIDVDLGRYADRIDSILRLLAENGKALEINTSGLRQPLGRTMPQGDIVRRFRELGGEYITVGSDAHYATDVGAGIREGMTIAAACGFSAVTLFQNRIPVQIPIA